MKKLGIFKDKKDDTIKCVFSENNNIIEMSLLMNRVDTDVVCVPSHHFCNLGCKMCHLTNNLLNKKMVPIKIDNFIEALHLTVCNQRTMERRTNKKILLISFMGVGEPLLNIDLIVDVYKNIDYLKKLLNYDYIGLALATMMPSSYQFTQLQDVVLEKHIPLKIHFFLHACNDVRNELIPATTVCIDDVFKLLENYSNTIKKDNIIMKEYRKFHKTDDIVEIHYTLIKNVNYDSDNLNCLIKLLQKYNFTVKFIKFNPVKKEYKNNMLISDKEEKWIDELTKNTSSRIKIYSPPGKDVGSSCYEFTKHYYHENIETIKDKEEFDNWKSLFEIID